MNFHSKILKILSQIKKSHPKYNLGRHISTSVDSNNMNDLWEMTDEELYNCLVKYEDKLNMDVLHDDDDDDINEIIKQGMNLNYNIDEFMEDEY